MKLLESRHRVGSVGNELDAEAFPAKTGQERIGVGRLVLNHQQLRRGRVHGASFVWSESAHRSGRRGGVSVGPTGEAIRCQYPASVQVARLSALASSPSAT